MPDSAGRGRTPDPSSVEAFYLLAAEEIRQPEAVIIALSPWTFESKPPANVLQLDRMSSEEINRALANKDLVLGASTFSSIEEIDFAEKHLPSVHADANEGALIVIFQMLPPHTKPDRSNLDLFVNCSKFVMDLGVEDVIFLPEIRPGMLARKLENSKLSQQNNKKRMSLVLSVLPPSPMPELAKLKSQHRRLMWEDIPSTLMPHLKPLDSSLEQTNTGIGEYTWTQEASSDSWRRGAKSKSGQHCSIKLISKEEIFTPVDLEGVYREYRFLSEFLKHPNLARCISMLHSERYLYFIFEGPNIPSLYQQLQTMPGKRFEGAIALALFTKIAYVLSYIHSKNCAHRNVSLESILVRVEGEGSDECDCKLCDFETAMTIKQEQTSVAMCGSFPSMAPEMALGKPYAPHLADCWSAGVVLLEMGAGMGCLQSFLRVSFEAHDRDIVVNSMYTAFNEERCYHKALEHLGAPPCEEVVDVLKRLLRLDPGERAEMVTFASKAEEDRS